MKRDCLATATMKETYLSRVAYSDTPSEIPQFLFIRMAVGLFYNDGIEAVVNIFKRYVRGDGISASPLSSTWDSRKELRLPVFWTPWPMT